MTGALNADEKGQELSEEAFRLRMESQCQEIEQYRLSQLREAGRRLSLDEAAQEWIERYAADFSQRCEFAID